MNRILSTLAAALTLACSSYGQTCVAPPPGLVGWWPGNGTTTDVQGGNNGSLENGATFGMGEVNQGFSLDGVDDYVLIPHNPNQNLSSYSLHAWIKIAHPSSDFQAVIAKSDNSVLGAETRNFGLFLNQDYGGPPPERLLHTSFAYAPGVFAAVQNITPMTYGLFHHVVATFETSVGLKIYFDGVDETTPTAAYPSTGIGVTPGLITAPITLGIDSPFANSYAKLSGIVDEAALFNRALSPTEVQALYAAGSAGMCEPDTANSLGPGTVWVGLKNSDDQGTQFDIGIDVYKNAALISSGTALCFTGITRNPANASMVSVPLASPGNLALQTGDTLTFKVKTRIGTNPDGSKCSGPGGSHSNAVGLRLYYDAPGAPSGFAAEIGAGPSTSFYLHSSGSALFFDTNVPVTGTAKTQDSTGVNFASGNQWKEIGAWSRVQP